MALSNKELEKELKLLKVKIGLNKRYRVAGWVTLFALTYEGGLTLGALLSCLIGWHALEFTYTLITNFDVIKKMYYSDEPQDSSHK